MGCVADVANRHHIATWRNFAGDGGAFPAFLLVSIAVRRFRLDGFSGERFCSRGHSVLGAGRALCWWSGGCLFRVVLTDLLLQKRLNLPVAAAVFGVGNSLDRINQFYRQRHGKISLIEGARVAFFFHWRITIIAKIIFSNIFY
jgi:hypothetical protein